MLKRILTLMLICSLSAGWAVAKELRTVIFKVAQLECPNCAKKVKKNICFEKGVKSIKTDLETRTVAITYDAEKTDVKKLQAGFKKFDYEAVFVEEKKGK